MGPEKYQKTCFEQEEKIGQSPGIIVVQMEGWSNGDEVVVWRIKEGPKFEYRKNTDWRMAVDR
jgi:hypothetical protein